MATSRASTRDEPRTIVDPRAIKALAHPARLAVLEELNDGGELTATECARIVGLSASAMSYHLRALEKWGFVERAEASADGRERPWRATSPRGWQVKSSTPVAAAAESALVAVSFERMRAAFQEWSDATGQPKPWQDLAILGSTGAWLTPVEVRELVTCYRQLVERTRGRRAASRPAGSRRVRLGLMVAPTPER